MRIKNKKKSAESDKMRATATTNMFGSRWMKNLKGLVIIMCLIIFGSQAVPTKAQNADTLALKIWVTDSLGNSDSAWVYVNSEADPELYEENLYGIEPQGNLDLRLIRRTDINYQSDTGLIQGKFWLVGKYNEKGGWCQSYMNNRDAKKSCIKSLFYRSDNYVLSIYANTFVSIYIDMPKYGTGIYDLVITAHNKDDGTIAFSKYANTFYLPYIPGECAFGLSQYEANNYFILIAILPHGGIKGDIEHKILYPNPSENYVILEDALLTTYNLIDNTGSVLKTFDVDITPYQLFINDLPDGNYFIVDEARKIFYKFIKLAR